MNYRTFTQNFARKTSALIWELNQTLWVPCSSLQAQGLGASLSLGSYRWINYVIMCVSVFKLYSFKSNLIKIQKKKLFNEAALTIHRCRHMCGIVVVLAR